MAGHAAAHAALNAKKTTPHIDHAHSTPASSGGAPRLSSVEQHMADLVADQAAEDAPTVYARFSDRPFFVITIAVAIILNAIQMGLELELRSDTAQTIWKVLENVFTAFFLGEMITKLIKDGVKDYFSLKANHLDFVIVLVAIVDNWILVLFMSDDDKEALSFLNLLKLVRLGRILKLLKMKRQLKLLVESIVNSLSSMFWLCVLLVILIYMISICMVQFVGRADGIYTKKEFDNKKYFGDMISAGVTGLNLALLDGFGEVIRPVLKRQPLYCIGLLMYVGVAAFGIMNAIIGVIVTKTSDAAAQLERENDSAYRKRQMAFVANVSNIIYAIDTDGDGTVSPEEIEMASDNQELIEILQDIDLPFSFSLGDLHCMLDKDGDGELTKVEFFTGMRRLIFSNDFHRQCLLSLGIAQMKRKMFELRLEMEDGFKMLSSKIDILIDHAGKAPPEAVLPPVAKPAPPEHPRPGEEIPRPPSNQTPATIVQLDEDDEQNVCSDVDFYDGSAEHKQLTQALSEQGNAGRNVDLEEHLIPNSLQVGKALALHETSMNSQPTQSQALIPCADSPAPYFKQLESLLEQTMRELNGKFDAIPDQISQMQKNYTTLNHNMQWMRGALQTTQAPLSEGKAPTGLPQGGQGPYTIAVTGASLIIQTTNMPTFSQPAQASQHDFPALPGSIGAPALGDQPQMKNMQNSNRGANGNPARRVAPVSPHLQAFDGKAHDC